MQSTIISHSTVKEIRDKLVEAGKKLPPLELPTVRLFGKDGKKGGKELYIRAQLLLTFQLKSKTVTVPVFVQLRVHSIVC